MNTFTPDDVVHLDRYQRSGQMHPFTCPNRGDGNHRDVGGDIGALFPTVRGWICPFCDYTQGWAHDFMKREPPPAIGARERMHLSGEASLRDAQRRSYGPHAGIGVHA